MITMTGGSALSVVSRSTTRSGSRWRVCSGRWGVASWVRSTPRVVGWSSSLFSRACPDLPVVGSCMCWLSVCVQWLNEDMPRWGELRVVSPRVGSSSGRSSDVSCVLSSLASPRIKAIRGSPSVPWCRSVSSSRASWARPMKPRCVCR